MGQLKELLKETDKKKFLKAFPTVSVKMDKSLTALMMIKASLPNFESGIERGYAFLRCSFFLCLIMNQQLF